jgi:hypothetical protein
MIGSELTRLTTLPIVPIASFVSRRSLNAMSTGLFPSGRVPTAEIVSEACRTTVGLVAMRSSTRTTPTAVSMRPSTFHEKVSRRPFGRGSADSYGANRADCSHLSTRERTSILPATCFAKKVAIAKATLHAFNLDSRMRLKALKEVDIGAL